MSIKNLQDIDFGGVARATNLPEPAAPSDALRRQDVQNVTTSANGLMLSADKAKLDGLDASGYARLGTTAPPVAYFYTAHNHATESAATVRQAGAGPIARFIKETTAGATDSAVKVEVTNTGGITATGAMVATDFTVSSDERLKEDVCEIRNAMRAVSQLTGVDYTLKATGLRRTGLIAQDVQRVKPEAVTEGEDGYLRLSEGSLVGLLVNALKELDARLARVEAQL